MSSTRDKAGRFTSKTASRKAEPEFDLRGSLQRLFTAAERSGDYAGCASLARVIRLEGEAAAPERRGDDLALLTAEQIEERLLHMLNESRVVRGQPPIEVPGALPPATAADVEMWLRGLTARGVRWRLFEGGNMCLDAGWLSSEDLIFVLVNSRSEAKRAAHTENRGDVTSRQPISTVRDREHARENSCLGRVAPRIGAPGEAVNGQKRIRGPVSTEKSVLVAAVDVTADDGYAAGRSCRYCSRSSSPSERWRIRAPRFSLKYLPCGTNWRCSSAPDRGGCRSRRRTAGSGSCSRAFGPDGQRRS